MSYQAIYRKFRPKTFEDVIGQEHVTTILKNQIQNDSIGHAYVFSGTRGTGKTSTAKIFARAVNCTNSLDGDPCNECEVCKGILDESIMDVVEMDAASNNSVEDIRELREKVKYLPSKGRYKVYIIDEVHMLSKGAFNALLKTLEEPPKHLLFILATTEPQKIPATILSRCQRYDFKRHSVDNIVLNMNKICLEIGVTVEEKGLRLIARSADGAMRDALSLLDQCVSFATEDITYEYVLNTLGTVNNDFLFKIIDAINQNDSKVVLTLIDQMVESGKDIHQFIKDLIMHTRNLMVAKSTDDLENILDISVEDIEILKKQAESMSINDIMNMITVLSKAESEAKWSAQPRIILETSILGSMSEVKFEGSEDLLNRIAKLEEIIKSGKISVQASDKPRAKKKVLRSSGMQDDAPKANQAPVSKLEIGEVNTQTIRENWGRILDEVKRRRISLHAFLREGHVEKIENNMIYISFDDGFNFHKDALNKDTNKDFIKGIINEMASSNLELNFVMKSEISSGEEEEEEDIVSKTLDIFGQDIVNIEE